MYLSVVFLMLRFKLRCPTWGPELEGSRPSLFLGLYYYHMCADPSLCAKCGGSQLSGSTSGSIPLSICVQIQARVPSVGAGASRQLSARVESYRNDANMRAGLERKCQLHKQVRGQAEKAGTGFLLEPFSSANKIIVNHYFAKRLIRLRKKP